MGNRKLKSRLKPGLKKQTQNLPTLESNPPTSSGEASRFAESELGEFLSKKIILRKYQAILKRKVNNGVTLKDLDSLQLELESLLLSSIKRRQLLLNEHSVLENDLEISDPDTTTLKRTAITNNVQQNAPIALVSASSIKFFIPRSVISNPVSKSKQSLSRKKDKLDNLLAPNIITNKLPEKITEVITGSNQTTYTAESSTTTSRKRRSTKLNNINAPSATLNSPPKAILSSPPKAILNSPPKDILNSPPKAIVNSPPKDIVNSPPKAILNSPPTAISASPLAAISTSPLAAISISTPRAIPNDLEDSENGNSLGKELCLVPKKNLKKSKQKQNLKEAKKKKIALKKEKPDKPKNRIKKKKGSIGRYIEPSKKFWQSLNHILRTISESDIKYLEDVLKNQEATEKTLMEPSATGLLYASSWADSELMEEKVFASETSLPRKGSVPMPQDVSCMMKRAEKLTDIEKGSLGCPELDPLSSQILSALEDGSIIAAAEQETKPATELQSVNKEEHLFNNSEMEKAIRMDLVNAGIISDQTIVRADTMEETEIDVKLNLAKNRLRALTLLSVCELNRVIKLAKQEVCKQNLNKQLINKGKEIEKAYHTILTQRRKGDPAAKHIKKALKLVVDRDTILSKLENLNQA